jgi:hypothetical protein
MTGARVPFQKSEDRLRRYSTDEGTMAQPITLRHQLFGWRHFLGRVNRSGYLDLTPPPVPLPSCVC